MTVRLHHQRRPEGMPASRRGLNCLRLPTPERVPEPRQLYALAVLYLVTHVPLPHSGRCQRCAALWPCESVRLAFRLREGF